MAIGSRIKRRPAPRRGPTSSEDFNATMDEAVTDIGTIVSEVNAQTAMINQAQRIRFYETAALQAQAERQTADQEARNLFAALEGESLTTVIDFRDFMGPDFEVNYNGLAEARRARMESLYGQVCLPYNAVVNNVYGVNTTTGLPVLPGTVETEVIGYNESGATVTAGTQKYAVNGMNQDYWIRKVRFPIYSDVDYIQATYQVNLPTTHASYMNMVSLHPYPLRWTDIVNIEYSTTTADPSTQLPGFSAVNSSGFRRWHFADLAITKIKVTLRQKHFVEENGFKVFYLGIQELLCQLVDFDRTTNPAAGPLGPTVGNGIVTKLDAPTGHVFNQITRFWSDPVWATGAADNKIYWRIYADAALTDERWSSWDDPSPQDTTVNLLASALTSIYVVLTLEWDDGNSVSPFVNRFALRYTVS